VKNEVEVEMEVKFCQQLGKNFMIWLFGGEEFIQKTDKLP
jgi:hypothetical protein